MTTTATTAQEATMTRNATIADELAAGRSFPARKVIVNGRIVRPSVAHLRAISAFWADAAAGYLALAEAGCTESIADAREALAISAHYAPSSA